MLPADDEIGVVHSQVLKKVANYMNKTHSSNYIVYNLFRDRQLDHAATLFHQITEYSFPKSTLIQGIAQDGLLKFSTAPPTLRQLFLIVLEMAAWINSRAQEQNVILLH